jgi:hypothetical protein
MGGEIKNVTDFGHANFGRFTAERRRAQSLRVSGLAFRVSGLNSRLKTRDSKPRLPTDAACHINS